MLHLKSGDLSLAQMLAAAAIPFVKRPLLFPPALDTGIERNGIRAWQHTIFQFITFNEKSRISARCASRQLPHSEFWKAFGPIS